VLPSKNFSKSLALPLNTTVAVPLPLNTDTFPADTAVNVPLDPGTPSVNVRVSSEVLFPSASWAPEKISEEETPVVIFKTEGRTNAGVGTTELLPPTARIEAVAEAAETTAPSTFRCTVTVSE
jgi:hypothetical protein